jgi:hypothetical protein
MRPAHLLVPAAAVVLGVTAVAGSSTAQTAAPDSRTVLTFTAHPTGGSGVDNAPKGPSVGDQFFERGTVRAADGSKAGTFQLVTQLVAGTAKHGHEHQSLSLHLDNGTVLTMGDTPTKESYTVAVIGGRGAYSGAAGRLAARSGKHGTVHLTLTLQR